jgi:hypothetical protein
MCKFELISKDDVVHFLDLTNVDTSQKPEKLKRRRDEHGSFVFRNKKARGIAVSERPIFMMNGTPVCENRFFKTIPSPNGSVCTNAPLKMPTCSTRGATGPVKSHGSTVASPAEDETVELRRILTTIRSPTRTTSTMSHVMPHSSRGKVVAPAASPTTDDGPWKTVGKYQTIYWPKPHYIHAQYVFSGNISFTPCGELQGAIDRFAAAQEFACRDCCGRARVRFVLPHCGDSTQRKPKAGDTWDVQFHDTDSYHVCKDGTRGCKLKIATQFEFRAQEEHL